MTVQAPTPPSHLYYSHSWIPHVIEVTLDENGDLSVEKLDKLSPLDDTNGNTSKSKVIVENGQGDNNLQTDSENDWTSFDEGEPVAPIYDTPEINDIANCGGDDDNSRKITKVEYILTAVVCYVDDKASDDRQHVVALIRVGPNYHERSTGSAVAQWYIFNDFR